MKRAYIEKRISADRLALIGRVNTIIDAYVAQGYTLSVRQIYYQLVARDIVPNTMQEYKRVADVVNDGRLVGLIDWDAIEDRNRDIELRTRWTSGSQIIHASAGGYHMDMWDNQSQRVIMVVEKAALEGVLGPVCRKWDVPLLAARGYPSVSIVRELVTEHIQQPVDEGQFVTILHFGDHDPSGIDMTRDLEERCGWFLDGDLQELEGRLVVKRCALNMDQVRELKPPPNPAKVTDSRFSAYAALYGTKSWELDAIEPSALANLAEREIEMLVDVRLVREPSETGRYSIWEATHPHIDHTTRVNANDAAEAAEKIESFWADLYAQHGTAEFKPFRRSLP